MVRSPNKFDWTAGWQNMLLETYCLIVGGFREFYFGFRAIKLWKMLFFRLFLGNKTSTPSIFTSQTCLGRGERLKFEAKIRNKLCYAVGWLKVGKEAHC
jgi:hypothetical protein